MNVKYSSVSLATVVLILAAGLPLTANADSTYQTADMLDFDTLNPVAGAATLTRTLNSATARIYTSGLDKKAAYTIWWVVFNDTEVCGDACGDADEDFVYPTSVFYAGGFITGTDGTANVTVHVDGDELAEGIDVLIGPGLWAENGFGAEIHLVVRTHSKMIVGRVDEQIGSYFGACEVTTCADTQAAVFAPVPY